jgi:hypothetical protein
MIQIDSNSSLTTFYHPFHNLLRGRVVTAATYWMRNKTKNHSCADVMQYQYPLTRYGEIIIGAEYDPKIRSIKIVASDTICELTAQPLNVRAFDISSVMPAENETAEMFCDRISAAYRPKYNTILGFDKILQPHHDIQYIVIVETCGPIEALGLVYLFLPPELLCAPFA